MQDESVEAAWDEEVARRMADMDSGGVRPVSLEEARRRLLSALPFFPFGKVIGLLHKIQAPSWWPCVRKEFGTLKKSRWIMEPNAGR